MSEDPTTVPHLMCGTVVGLWWDLNYLVKCVLQATIANKKTSGTTHFKKLTTGNNLFIVSVII